MAITSLENLILSHNELSGPLPYWVTEDVSPNHLDDRQFVSLTKTLIQPPIHVLDLSDNQINGEISIRSLLRSYEMLNLSLNEINGNIPSAIQFLGHLRTLHLHSNHPSGSIPNMMLLTQLRKYVSKSR